MISVVIYNIKQYLYGAIVMAVPLRLTKLFIQTSAIHSGAFRTKVPPLATEGRGGQNLLLKTEGRLIKTQNKINL